MPDSFQYDVFLSHNAQDKPRVRRLAPVSQLSTLNCPHGTADFSQSLESQPSRTAVHRDPANAGRRFIPFLLGDCALPDTLRRCKHVEFREESEAAFAKLLSTGPAETGAMKRRFGLPHGARGASKRRRARQSEATRPTTIGNKA